MVLLDTTISILIILFYFILYITIMIFFLICIMKFAIHRKKNNNLSLYSSLAFLHPNFSDFGGGEKVLWEMIKALSLYKKNSNNTNSNPITKIYILGNNKYSLSDVQLKLKDIFNISLDKCFFDINTLQVVRLTSTCLLSPKNYITMFLQIIGQVILAFEIALKVNSKYILDTTGLPFTYYLLKLFGFNVSAYIHYPFISNKMIQDVIHNKNAVHNNLKNKYLIRKILKPLKIMYYKIINELYKINIKCLSFAFTNSSWTNNHFNNTDPTNKFNHNVKLAILYPPCTINEFYPSNEIENKRIIASKSKSYKHKIVSIAQFRPEKNHIMQVEIIEDLVYKRNIKNIKLNMLGGARNDNDFALVNNLKKIIKQKNLDNHIEIHCNLPFLEIIKMFHQATIGLHTMKDEHFGIAIIEMMAAGLVTIAHNSAGPKLDIINNLDNYKIGTNGFLADSKIFKYDIMFYYR